MEKGVPKQGLKPVAIGNKGMVSSSHPAVTAVMVDVMKAGGNAVDAAVAGSLVQPVYEVHMTNHAGTVAFLYWDASTNRSYFMDACAELPKGLKPFSPNPYAPSSAACIPGFIPGLADMLRRFGTKSWSELCEPAVKTARDGIIVTPWQYGYLHQTLAYRTYYPTGRDFFTPEGFLPTAGEVWKTPSLSLTLERLMIEGPEYFTKGGWAKKFVEEGNKLGWDVRLEDLAGYQPEWLEPLSFKHGEDTIVGMPPPQRGGLYTALILGILRCFNLREMGHYSKSADSLKLIAWVLARAHGEKNLMHDPKFYDVPVNTLLSSSYHKQLASLYSGVKPKIDLAPWMKINLSKSALNAGLPGVERRPHDSCELSVVDPQGNWVQMMNTGNGGGIPGLVVDGVECGGTAVSTGDVTGTGRFGVVVEPGARTRHAIASTLLLREGSPWLGIGSPGDCIFTVPETLINILEYGMDPYSAVDAPRFWPLGDDGTLEIENRIQRSVIEDLLSLGVIVRPAGTYDWRMGSMQLVYKNFKTGKLEGVADPRRLGIADGFS